MSSSSFGADGCSVLLLLLVQLSFPVPHPTAKGQYRIFPEQTYFFPSILFFCLRERIARSAAVDSADSFLSGLIVVARFRRGLGLREAR